MDPPKSVPLALPSTPPQTMVLSDSPVYLTLRPVSDPTKLFLTRTWEHAGESLVFLEHPLSSLSLQLRTQFSPTPPP